MSVMAKCKMRRRLSGLGILLYISGVDAADLSTQISQFFQHQYANNSVQVTVKTPTKQWPQCEHPEITLPAHSRPWGSVSLSVRCGQRRRFVQVQVQVRGRYLVTTRYVAPGEKLMPADLRLQPGRLDNLPAGALRDMKQVQGAISLRSIHPGQPLTPAMVRRVWVIRAGQEIQVRARGEGFSISSQGKAMNNAAVEDDLRVRLASGQIVSGTASEDGVMHVRVLGTFHEGESTGG